ncbi:MAG: M24 family metallopeptidase [Planctomycetaceae bacterium]|nr:M24 family metallopeptidase [Planctomycetaceae bacterium]
MTFEHFITGPPSSHEIPISDPERTADIDAKHQQVAEFLESHRYDALLLEEANQFAWFTSGGNCSRYGAAETTAALFITPEARVVVTSNVDSARLFERELPGLGFQLKQRPWHEPRHLLLEDICRGRTVASDSGRHDTHNVSSWLKHLRNPLTLLECERVRELGRQVAHAVEATARHCSPGRTEADVAGELAHRLLRHQIIPQRIQVSADGRTQRYRYWSHGRSGISRYATISAAGARQGLNVSATRTVSFGDPPQDLKAACHRALLVQATAMYFSQANWELHEVWKRIGRIFEKFGCREEWHEAPQGELMGYELCEVPIVPASEFRLEPRMMLHWHPSIGPSLTGDTILVGHDRFELLTPSDEWPQVKVAVKGESFSRPDILRLPREVQTVQLPPMG